MRITSKRKINSKKVYLIYILIFVGGLNLYSQEPQLTIKKDSSQTKEDTLEHHFFSDYSISPGIKSTDDWKIASPLAHLNMGLGFNIGRNWNIQQNIHLYGGNANWMSYSQSQYYLGSTININSEFKLKTNIHFINLNGNLFNSEISTYSDTTLSKRQSDNVDIETVNNNKDSVITTGKNKEATNIYYLGVERTMKSIQVELGIGYLGFWRSTKINNKTTTTGDKIETEVISKSTTVTPISKSDSSSFDSTYHYSFFQPNLRVKYTLPYFKEAIVTETEIKTPINNQGISFSATQDIRFRFTSNTWLGGTFLYNSKYNSIEKNGKWVLNTTDYLQFRYGGYIFYEPSKKWDFTFHLTLSKRIENHLKKKYDQLGLYSSFKIYIR